MEFKNFYLFVLLKTVIMEVSLFRLRNERGTFLYFNKKFHKLLLKAYQVLVLKNYYRIKTIQTFVFGTHFTNIQIADIKGFASSLKLTTTSYAIRMFNRVWNRTTMQSDN